MCARIEGVGVAHPGLDLGDAKLARPDRDRRRRAGRGGRSQAPAAALRAARPEPRAQARASSRPADRRASAPRGQGLQAPQPARWHRRRRRRGARCAAGSPPGAQAAWAKSWAERPMRRSGDGRPSCSRMGRETKGSSGARPRPGALLQAGEDQPVGAHEARLQHPQDLQARVGRAAAAQGLPGHQAVEQIGEPGGGRRRQGVALLHQRLQQGGQSLARPDRPTSSRSRRRRRAPERFERLRSGRARLRRRRRLAVLERISREPQGVAQRAGAGRPRFRFGFATRLDRAARIARPEGRAGRAASKRPALTLQRLGDRPAVSGCLSTARSATGSSGSAESARDAARRARQPARRPAARRRRSRR